MGFSLGFPSLKTSKKKKKNYLGAFCSPVKRGKLSVEMLCIFLVLDYCIFSIIDVSLVCPPSLAPKLFTKFQAVFSLCLRSNLEHVTDHFSPFKLVYSQFYFGTCFTVMDIWFQCWCVLKGGSCLLSIINSLDSRKVCGFFVSLLGHIATPHWGLTISPHWAFQCH